MADNKKTFHEWALESILFKGRYDWYFCFLKAERIAHVLSLLGDKLTHTSKKWFSELIDEAASLPPTVVHFAAGEAPIEAVLADIFSLIMLVRLSATRGMLATDTAGYIAEEYEKIAEKIASGNQLSPFVSPQDFSVPEFLTKPRAPEALPRAPLTSSINSVAEQPMQREPVLKPKSEQSGRRAAILHFVLENKAVSIKEICAVVPDCSEKTVQRELAGLIEEGLIKREGERRWSVYKPV